VDDPTPVWKPAIQQIWKSALQNSDGQLPALSSALVVAIQMFSTKQNGFAFLKAFLKA
jgi:hypothetical protein